MLQQRELTELTIVACFGTFPTPSSTATPFPPTWIFMAEGGEEESVTKCDNDDEFAWRWTISNPPRPLILSQERLSVTFHPRKSMGCAAVLGDKPLLKHMEHFFEVVMSGPFHGQARMVGVGNKCAPLQSASKDFYPLIGKDTNSWGFNYTGEIIHDSSPQPYIKLDSASFKDGLLVGVYYDSYYGNLSFSVNGRSPGIAFENVPFMIDLHPMIASSSANSTITLISSHSSVMSLKALCRGTVRMYTREEDIERLPVPPHIISYLTFKTY